MSENRIAAYERLSREQLIERLTAAEDVCCMVGWSVSPGQNSSDRELARTELFMRWSDVAGDGASSPRANPHLSDDEIHVLAGLRRLTREATVAKLRRVYGDER